jgi:hypothetical protein
VERRTGDSARPEGAEEGIAIADGDVCYNGNDVPHSGHLPLAFPVRSYEHLAQYRDDGSGG